MGSRLRIGLVYDLLGSAPAGLPDADAEYEPIETVEALEGAIRLGGHEPVRLGSPRELLGAIPGVRWIEPAGAFYVFVDLRERLAATTELAFELARAGRVLVVPGEGFGPTGQGWLRLSFSVPEADIREGVARLAAALG